MFRVLEESRMILTLGDVTSIGGSFTQINSMKANLTLTMRKCSVDVQISDFKEYRLTILIKIIFMVNTAYLRDT